MRKMITKNQYHVPANYESAPDDASGSWNILLDSNFGLQKQKG
jgi:hypothetical protein